MNHQWFRLYHDFIYDPKLRTIARIAKRPISEVVTIAISLFTVGSNATERGRTQPYKDEDFATLFEMNIEHIVSIKDAMQNRMLAGDLLTGWAKRQPKKEDGAAERSRLFREREKIIEELKIQYPILIGLLPNATERKRTLDKNIDLKEDKKINKKNSKKNKMDFSADFLELKAAYPQNLGNDEIAFTGFQKIIKNNIEDKQLLISRAGAYARHVAKAGIVDIKYVKKLSNWLREKDFNVDYDNLSEANLKSPENKMIPMPHKMPSNPEWAQVWEVLKGLVEPSAFVSWISKLELKTIDEKSLVLLAPSEFFRGEVEKRFMKNIKSATRKCFPKIENVEIVHNPTSNQK